MNIIYECELCGAHFHEKSKCQKCEDNCKKENEKTYNKARQCKHKNLLYDIDYEYVCKNCSDCDCRWLVEVDISKKLILEFLRDGLGVVFDDMYCDLEQIDLTQKELSRLHAFCVDQKCEFEDYMPGRVSK